MYAPDIKSIVKNTLERATEDGHPAFTPTQVDAIAEAINKAIKKLASSNPS